MTHQPRTKRFKQNVREAMANENLQKAMTTTGSGFVGKRAAARAGVPEFDQIRDAARDLKNHVLGHLDLYLERYEEKVVESGGHVHWAETAEDMQRIVLDICRKAGAKTVNKGKTMISEEAGINDFLTENGIQPVETDLGEYIIQLRGETPSHIIAPAIHVTTDEVETLFRERHTHLPEDRNLSELSSMLSEARTILRQKYFEAEVGITGANMLIAETGQSVIVTNEGNGDLSQSLPKVHIVLASLEKIVPTLDDAATVLRVLARSATGQEMSVYTTLSSGPRRSEDPDGPEEYHVILLDNGRTEMIGTEFSGDVALHPLRRLHEPLPCLSIRRRHAYGWVYPGPMGAVLTPSLIGVEEGGMLPNASTFAADAKRCALCGSHFQDDATLAGGGSSRRISAPKATRYGLGLWAFFADGRVSIAPRRR